MILKVIKFFVLCSAPLLLQASSQEQAKRLQELDKSIAELREFVYRTSVRDSSQMDASQILHRLECERTRLKEALKKP